MQPPMEQKRKLISESPCLQLILYKAVKRILKMVSSSSNSAGKTGYPNAGKTGFPGHNEQQSNQYEPKSLNIRSERLKVIEVCKE